MVLGSTITNTTLPWRHFSKAQENTMQNASEKKTLQKSLRNKRCLILYFFLKKDLFSWFQSGAWWSPVECYKLQLCRGRKVNAFSVTSSCRCVSFTDDLTNFLLLDITWPRLTPGQHYRRQEAACTVCVRIITVCIVSLHVCMRRRFFFFFYSQFFPIFFSAWCLMDLWRLCCLHVIMPCGVCWTKGLRCGWVRRLKGSHSGDSFACLEMRKTSSAETWWNMPGTGQRLWIRLQGHMRLLYIIYFCVVD